MNTFDTYQAEFDYRSNRVRKDVPKRGRRHTRFPFVRRPAEDTRADR